MPDFWSHQYAAQKTLETLEDLKLNRLGIDDDTINYYYFGSQGPDFFYYVNKTKPHLAHKHYSTIGSRLHDEPPKNIIDKMLNYYEAHPSNAIKAYIAGYITHYNVDCASHPLITAKVTPNFSHKKLELWYDALLMRDHLHTPIHQMRLMPSQSLNCQSHMAIMPMWGKLVAMSPNKLKTAWTDMLLVQDYLIQDKFTKLKWQPLLSKVFKFDLSTMQYPYNFTKDEIKYLELEAFESTLLDGIEKSVLTLRAFSQYMNKEIGKETFLACFETHDYLGLERG